MSVKEFLTKNAAKILFGIGVGLSIGSVVETIKHTPEAKRRLDNLYALKEQESDEKVVVKKTEIIRDTWTCYIPTVLMLGGSIACFAMSNSKYKNEAVAVAAAYEVAKTSLKEYRHYKDAVVEEVGEEVEKKISEKVSQKKIDESNKPDEDSPVLVCSNDDEVTFYLDIPGSTKHDALYFKSTLNEVYYKFNELNEMMLAQSEVDMNDICSKFNVPNITYGNIVGYRPEITGQIQWRPNPIMIDKFHPGICIEFLTKPVDFRRSYI